MISVMSVSFVLTWFRIKSKSLWAAVILHSSHNQFTQSLFKPLTEDVGKVAYYIGEFGIILSIISLCLGVYFWTKRGQLKPVPNKGYN